MKFVNFLASQHNRGCVGFPNRLACASIFGKAAREEKKEDQHDAE
jgi:hypothetical protein